MFRGTRRLASHCRFSSSCTVFAYGVTSSGKTHTIQGTAEQPGIIPRVVNVSSLFLFPFSLFLFTSGCMAQALLEKKREMSEKTVSLSLSYMEIYKDEAYDLLVPRETVSHPNFSSAMSSTEACILIRLRRLSFPFARIQLEKSLSLT